jgi:predicted NBD/HSP70 family sugar kinase
LVHRPLSGTNLGQARSFNRRVVLETVRLRGPLSRADVARATSLSVQTVSNIAEELIGADLLTERPRDARSARGAPGFDLALNPEGGATIGISLDQSHASVLLVDLAGSVRGQRGLELARGLAPETAIDRLGEAVGTLIHETGVARDRLWGAGIVLPGLFEHGSLVRFGPSSVPQWSGFPLAARLAGRLALPVLTDNDATAAAIGEALYGTARGLSDFIYLHVGTGIGGGMFLGGQPYRGSGKAGEIGHFVTEPNGRPCPCGNRGCLERYASIGAALACLAAGDDPAVLMRALAAGDARMRAWLDEATTHLARAIVALENMLDPQTIVLGGTGPESVLDALAARLASLPRGLGDRPARVRPRLARGTAGRDTPALGAAALPVFEGMAPSFAVLAKVPRAGPTRLRVA